MELCWTCRGQICCCLWSSPNMLLGQCGSKRQANSPLGGNTLDLRSKRRTTDSKQSQVLVKPECWLGQKGYNEQKSSREATRSITHQWRLGDQNCNSDKGKPGTQVHSWRAMGCPWNSNWTGPLLSASCVVWPDFAQGAVATGLTGLCFAHLSSDRGRPWERTGWQ